MFQYPASFRFPLTMDALAFSYILPTAEQIRDLHSLDCAHAECT